MKKNLLRLLVLAFSLLLAMGISLGFVYRVSRAQGPVGMTKVLNKSGNVVRVGEVISFTIFLENTSPFTLTSVTLVDEYDRDTLAFAGASIAPDDHSPGSGRLTWTNVATPPVNSTEGMPPGDNITLTVVFTTVHPKPVVVNRVRAQDLISAGGQLAETVETSRTQEAPPNNVPVFKAISPPGSLPQVGWPVTFTHVITNDGASTLLRLPLTDTFNTTFLQFQSAIPTPTTVLTGSPTGILAWENLVDDFGPIPPFGTVVVTTVFTAMARIVDTVNEARVEGAMDEYNNIWAPWAAQVPITIIDDSPTPQLKDSDKNDDDDQDDSPAPTATAPAVTATPVGTPAAETGGLAGPQGPRYLPETGRPFGPGLLFLAGWLLFLAGWQMGKVKARD